MPRGYFTRRIRPLEERFWKHVDRTPGHGPQGDCWIWTGSRTVHGYGQIKAGKTTKASRVAWFLATGAWPTLHVLHKCDHPPCVNPDHLFEGTHADNMADMHRKNRHVSGERYWSIANPEKRPRGERHGRAKLTDALVRQIRATYATGKTSMSRIARELSLDITTISNVVRRETWGHIE